MNHFIERQNKETGDYLAGLFSSLAEASGTAFEAEELRGHIFEIFSGINAANDAFRSLAKVQGEMRQRIDSLRNELNGMIDRVDSLERKRAEAADKSAVVTGWKQLVRASTQEAILELQLDLARGKLAEAEAKNDRYRQMLAANARDLEAARAALADEASAASDLRCKLAAAHAHIRALVNDPR